MLWWDLLFGSIGLGYFAYGRKQRAALPLACGVGLMVMPYVLPNALSVAAAGLALMAVPWLFR
jgi:hypothetical protein